MLRKWGLSEQYSLVVRFHENPNPYNFPDTQSFEISRLLYLSLLLSKILILEFPLTEKLNHAEQLAEQYNIPENEFGPFLRQTGVPLAGMEPDSSGALPSMFVI